MSAIELLPCPFCGGEAELQIRPNAMSKWRHSVGCASTSCGASGPVEDRKHRAVDEWNRRTDLSQASVAAALEAAAALCDRGHAGVYWGSAIRALITPDQHDALAAHVAAEVAKARAEDADLLYSAWLGLRVLENISKVKSLSGAADVVTPLLAEIEAAHPEFAPRSALRSQIGAKP